MSTTSETCKNYIRYFDGFFDSQMLLLKHKEIEQQPTKYQGISYQFIIEEYIKKWRPDNIEDFIHCLESEIESESGKYLLEGDEPNGPYYLSKKTDYKIEMGEYLVSEDLYQGDEYVIVEPDDSDDFEMILKRTLESAGQTNEVASRNQLSAANTSELTEKLTGQVKVYESEHEKRKNYNQQLITAITNNNKTIGGIQNQLPDISGDISAQINSNKEILSARTPTSAILNTFSTMGISNKYNLDGHPSLYENFL